MSNSAAANGNANEQDNKNDPNSDNYLDDALIKPDHYKTTETESVDPVTGEKKRVTQAFGLEEVNKRVLATDKRVIEMMQQKGRGKMGLIMKKLFISQFFAKKDEKSGEVHTNNYEATGDVMYYQSAYKGGVGSA